MNTGTVVTILVVALIVVVLLLLIRAAMGRSRRPSMRPLAPESRERFVTEWDQIEQKFIDAPEEAVRHAESVVMSVLRERGHPLSEKDLPDEMRRAHKLSYSSRDRTEGMRQAMLHYRAVMERMLGSETQKPRVEEKRREMA